MIMLNIYVNFKMVGIEGKLDTLLPKACFEEVKLHDVNNTSASSAVKPPKPPTTTPSQDKRAGNDRQRQKPFTQS